MCLCSADCYSVSDDCRPFGFSMVLLGVVPPTGASGLVPCGLCLWACASGLVPLGLCLLDYASGLVSLGLCLFLWACSSGLVPLGLCLWACASWIMPLGLFLWACSSGLVPLGLCAPGMELVPLDCLGSAHWIRVVLRLDVHMAYCAHMALVLPHCSHCPATDETPFVVIIADVNTRNCYRDFVGSFPFIWRI